MTQSLHFHEATAHENIANNRKLAQGWNRAVGVLALLLGFRIVTVAVFGFTWDGILQSILFAVIIGLSIKISGMYTELAGVMEISLAIIKQTASGQIFRNN